MEKIIFENFDKTIGIIHPSKEGYALGMLMLGRKDTPKGLPFWIVDESEIPIDRTNRDAWQLDGTQGVPDGYGE